ncbi:MAG: NADH-ubiquinone oxidoreductase-F iron-sulfur binding region domain-containing protein [Pseudomonadota bacterium]
MMAIFVHHSLSCFKHALLQSKARTGLCRVSRWRLPTCREGSGWLYQLLTRIEEGDAKTKDLDLALEIATSMGSMPGTTICGLADGNAWAAKTIMNKFRDEFEDRVHRTFVPVKVSVGASARG